MKPLALFLGCTIPARLTQYESAARAVLDRLDVRAIDIKAFNCCGYPLRNINFEAFVLLSARNLALAERKGLDIMALCQCCFGTLKKAHTLLKEDESLRKEINAVLAKERLRYEGGVEVRHLLQVLYHEVGIKTIKKHIARRFEGLQVAAHYGCHVLRPSPIVQFDNPVSPSLLDELVGVTGAVSVPWQRRLECCGAPLRGVNDDLSIALTRKKLEDAHGAGAAYLCVACPYCQIQFDTVQGGSKNHLLPSLLYPQLLGLSMGINTKALGLEEHQVPIEGIEVFLAQGNRRRGARPPEDRGEEHRGGARRKSA
ncbi:MAG: disulfide reductase [Deltaproteobacteria bacterium]|nr:disulfide reductase [Deltaproteobacteria bacterium]